MTTNVKTRGGINHVISQLQIKNLITENDAEHLKREIGYGRIINFRHLAEWLLAWGFIDAGNYDRIIEYGKRFGEY